MQERLESSELKNCHNYRLKLASVWQWIPRDARERSIIPLYAPTDKAQ